MQSHQAYQIQLPSTIADAVDGLAAAAQQPTAAIIATLVQAGLSALVDDRQTQTLTPRQWRGLIIEYHARNISAR